MSQHTARIDKEMGSVQMLPSDAAATVTNLLRLRDHLLTQPQSWTRDALLSILSVQDECFREAGVLWTEAFAPGSLAKMDASGEVTVRLALPNDALVSLLNEADDMPKVTR